MGKSLAGAAADASLDLINKYDMTTMIGGIQDQLDREVAPARECPNVTDVRVLGAIGVVEMKEPVNMGLIQAAFVKEGVWVRPFGKLVYVMPPFIIRDWELQRLTSALLHVISYLK